MSNNSKQDASTTASHSKRIIDMLKNICSGAGVSTIWENTDGCYEHYICAKALFLLSILSQSYNIIIDSWTIVPGHVK